MHLVWNTARLCLKMLLCALVQCKLYIKHKISEQIMNFKCEEAEIMGQALYRVSQEECARLRESVPYVKVYRYNPKHLYPKLNGYGDIGQRSLKL